MYRIVRKEALKPTVILYEIEAPMVAKKAEPGQFIILRVDENGERIPITIHDYDREKGTVTIIVQTVGATTEGTTFLTPDTLYILGLGIVAFSFGTAGGVLLGKLMNKLSRTPVNPLIGSAGVSAVPMAARVSQKVGQEEDPGNFLLMHAMGPNVSGVIGSAVAAGVFIALFA